MLKPSRTGTATTVVIAGWAGVLLHDANYFDNHFTLYHPLAIIANELVWSMCLFALVIVMLIGIVKNNRDIQALALIGMAACFAGMSVVFLQATFYFSAITHAVWTALILYRVREIARGK